VKTARPALAPTIAVLCAVAVVGFLVYRFVLTEAKPRPGLAGIRAGGELVVLTVESPTTAYEVDGRLIGFEVDLARAFAKSLDVKATFRFVPGLDGLLEAVAEGRGHIAAAGLTQTRAREAFGAFGPSYRDVTAAVVCRRGIAAPKSVAALADLTIAVPASSSYIDLLEQAKTEVPELTWKEVPSVATEGLFEAIEQGRYDCTIADSNIVAINHRYHPEMRRAFEIATEQRLAWLVAPASAATAEGDDGLLGALDTFFERARERGTLATLDERYYGHLRAFDYVEIARFVRRIESRLPDFVPLFQEAAAESGFPWMVLAAQSYQESRWDPRARSPTGVRGMMMLTRATARELGVENRLDPEASIRGGARYLKKTYERLPDGLTGEDRLWAALAAYNVGFGHLLDARILAERQGLDKNLWKDLREVLPLLARKQYYKTVPRGYARGGEPVAYVDRVREFHAILKNEWDGSAMLATADGAGDAATESR